MTGILRLLSAAFDDFARGWMALVADRDQGPAVVGLAPLAAFAGGVDRLRAVAWASGGCVGTLPAIASFDHFKAKLPKIKKTGALSRHASRDFRQFTA